MSLLMGRVFVAALFLPSGLHKLMTFSAYAASLKAKGLPFAVLWAVVLVAAEVLGPVALIIGAWPRWTALALVAFTAVTLWVGHRTSLVGAVFRPRQNAEFYRTLASWVACCSTSRVGQAHGAGKAAPDEAQRSN